MLTMDRAKQLLAATTTQMGRVALVVRLFGVYVWRCHVTEP